jgi:hypothetical protein
MTRCSATLLAVFVFLSPTVVLSAPRAPPPRGGGKTIVKFDGDTIDGNLMRPDGDLMAGRPEIPMPSLVQPPRSFDVAERRTLLAAAASVEKNTVKPVAARASRAQPMKDGAAGNPEGADGGRGSRSSGGAR